MLGGVAPIFLINFKVAPAFIRNTLAKIPLAASIADKADLPVIPIYLDEQLTGLFLDSESKGIEIETITDTLSSGGSPVTDQKGLQSTVKIEILAKRDAVGLMLFSALSDLIFPKVTSKDYSISYLHGATNVFNGLLHSFNISQSRENDLAQISIELVKPAATTTPKSTIPIVGKITGAVPL